MQREPSPPPGPPPIEDSRFFEDFEASRLGFSSISRFRGLEAWIFEDFDASKSSVGPSGYHRITIAFRTGSITSPMDPHQSKIRGLSRTSRLRGLDFLGFGGFKVECRTVALPSPLRRIHHLPLDPHQSKIRGFSRTSKLRGLDFRGLRGFEAWIF